MMFINWVVTNCAGNLAVDSLFAIPGWIAYVRLHRKLDRHHAWHTAKDGAKPE